MKYSFQEGCFSTNNFNLFSSFSYKTDLIEMINNMISRFNSRYQDCISHFDKHFLNSQFPINSEELYTRRVCVGIMGNIIFGRGYKIKTKEDAIVCLFFIIAQFTAQHHVNDMKFKSHGI